MKTNILFSFLIGATLLPVLGFSSENLNVSIRNVESRKAVVEVTNKAEKAFEVTIVDEMGQSIYSHKTNEIKPGFNKKFDFSGLEKGEYRLSVKTDGGSKEQIITIGADGITYGKEITKSDPFFIYNNDRLTLSFINHQNEMTKFFLYENDELVWEKDLNSASLIKKGFDLSNLPRGQFKAVLTAGDEVYEYELSRQ